MTDTEKYFNELQLMSNTLHNVTDNLYKRKLLNVMGFSQVELCRIINSGQFVDYSGILDKTKVRLKIKEEVIELDRLKTIKQYAEDRQIKEKTAYGYVVSSKVKSYKIGGIIFIYD